jgi:alpha-L-arabinofuranosidase
MSSCPATPIRSHLLLGLALLGAAAWAAAQDGSQLVNAGFEDSQNLLVWKQWVYADGRPPVIRVEDREAKQGRQSLLIQADDPADVALGQIAALPPGSVWRARAWVKTENLRTRDRTDTAAALHLQMADGMTVARGPSTFGTAGWKETAVVFRVPADGRIKVTLFYIGYGKGTGKVWFDDVRLEPVSPAGQAEVRLTSSRLATRPIDPKQGGQFIEPLCNLLPSLLAQQVANTSFEVDPPWNVAFKRAVDKPHRPWYPDGAVHLAKYGFETNQPFNGQRSLRIELPAALAWAGMSQDGFYLKEGLNYRLRLHLRGTGDPRVRATLHGAGGLAASPVSLGRAGSAWRPAEAVLRATRTLNDASLTLEFEGPGTLWLDRVSLIGEDAVLGLWRPDAVEAIRALQPAVIRFGGSALETYEWDRCLGNWDRRAPFPQTYWGGIEENFVGVEEFVAFCQAIGAEPLVCLRWSGKTPADAAAQVEYFNGPSDSAWGRRRAANGHPQPYGVKYWQIGNEVGGPTYDASVKAFAQAMRAADPAIKILSSFPSEQMLQAGGGYLDYLCPHHYGCADLPAMAHDFDALESQIRRFAVDRAVRIAVTEWNTTAGDFELGRASLQTLANALACSRYHNLMHRHADAVEIAIRSNLIDSFGSGVILTGPGWLYVAPTYHAQRLYARAAGSYPVRVEQAAAAAEATLPWHLEEPDLSAALSPDGATLRLYGVNSTGKAIEVKTALTGFDRRVRAAQAYVLKDSQGGPTPEVMNSRDEPDRVRVVGARPTVSGSQFVLPFEPFSLTLYEFTLE